MFVYLAHPIDVGRIDGAVARATEAITQQGYAVFDPGRAWTLGPLTPQIAATVDRANLALIKRSAGVVAVVDPGLLSFGVPLELQYASRRGRPILVYSLAEGADLVLRQSMFLAAMGAKIVGTDRDLTDQLRRWSSSPRIQMSNPALGDRDV